MSNDHSVAASQRRALRVREYCELYGRSRSWLYEQIRAGKIKTVRLGGSRLVPVDEAERLLREGC